MEFEQVNDDAPMQYIVELLDGRGLIKGPAHCFEAFSEFEDGYEGVRPPEFAYLLDANGSDVEGFMTSPPPPSPP